MMLKMIVLNIKTYFMINGRYSKNKAVYEYPYKPYNTYVKIKLTGYEFIWDHVQFFNQKVTK